MFVGVWYISFGSISPFEVFIYLGSSSLEHSESGVGDGLVIGATTLYMWGRWRVFSETGDVDGEGRGWEWDGGEVPHANMAILDKDGGRGGVVTGGEISAAGASDQAVQ
jgi:hypothetical protein